MESKVLDEDYKEEDTFAWYHYENFESALETKKLFQKFQYEDEMTEYRIFHQGKEVEAA